MAVDVNDQTIGGTGRSVTAKSLNDKAPAHTYGLTNWLARVILRLYPRLFQELENIMGERRERVLREIFDA